MESKPCIARAKKTPAFEAKIEAQASYILC